MTLFSPHPQRDLDACRAMLEAAASSGEVFEWSLAPFDRLSLPEWGVALLARDGALHSGFGGGPPDVAAQASAWGEVAARFRAHVALHGIPDVRATYYELWQEGRRSADPIALCLPAGSRYTHAQPLTWIEARRHPSGETVLVPIETVAPHADDLGSHVDRSALLFAPTPRGLGMGLTLELAITNGLLDLVQCDGSSVNMGALDRGGLVELNAVRERTTHDLLRYFDEEGIEIMVKLAGLDFGIANLYVVGYDLPVSEAPHAAMLAAHGAAAHPNREHALVMALRRFALARARLAFNHAPPDVVRAHTPSGYIQALRTVRDRHVGRQALDEAQRRVEISHLRLFDVLAHTAFSMREQISFVDLPDADVPDDALLSLLTERVAQAGMEVLYVPFTPPDAPAHAVKVIVPGLEANTATEHRIGRRNVERLLRRNSPLVAVGEPAAGMERVRLTPEDEYALGGPAWLDTAALDRMVKPLALLHHDSSPYPFSAVREM